MPPLSTGVVGLYDPKGKLSYGILGESGLGVVATEQPAWDPSREKGPGGVITYTDSNRTISGGATSANHAVAATFLETGDDIRDSAFDLLYVEGIGNGASAGNGVMIGMQTASEDPAAMGSRLPGFGYSTNGFVALDGNNQAQVDPSDGDRVHFAVDFVNDLIYWGINGVWENGDPAVPSGGDAIDSRWTVSGQVMSLRAASDGAGGWTLPTDTLHLPVGYANWPTIEASPLEPILALTQGLPAVQDAGAGNIRSGFRFGADGIFYEVRTAGITARATLTDWIEPGARAGDLTGYEVRARPHTSEPWAVEAAADDIWIDMSVDREWHIETNIVEFILASGIEFEMRKGSSGEFLVEVSSLVCSANRTS